MVENDHKMIPEKRSHKMKITEQQLREILKEEIESILNEVELTPAMYNALKAQGRLPAGAKVKPIMPARLPK